MDPNELIAALEMRIKSGHVLVSVDETLFLMYEGKAKGIGSTIAGLFEDVHNRAKSQQGPV